MASVSVRLNIGQGEFSIVEGTTAPTGGDAMFAVDLTKLTAAPNNQQVIDVLQKFINYFSSAKSTKVQ